MAIWDPLHSNKCSLAKQKGIILKDHKIFQIPIWTLWELYNTFINIAVVIIIIIIIIVFLILFNSSKITILTFMNVDGAFILTETQRKLFL